MLYFYCRYYPPLVSKRVAAGIRKNSIIEGTFGSFVPNEGGWDPSWDTTKQMFMLKPARGRKNERTREQRFDYICI